MGPLSRATTAAGEQAARRKARPWEITAADFFTDVERLRTLFAALVGGDAEGVALMPSASYALATAAANLPVPPGSSVLVLAEQFPSNVYAWRDLAERAGGSVRTV